MFDLIDMKNSLLNPIPKTIREFRWKWLRPEFLGYSDKEIKTLLKKIIKDDEKYLTLGSVTYKRKIK